MMSQEANRNSGETHSPNPESRAPSPDLFDLTPDEIQVVLRLKTPRGRHELLHCLRPPSLEEWREYERNLRSTVESVEQDGEETLRFDTKTLEAAAELYDRIFLRAEGYRGGESGVAAERIPVHHKEMVVRGLTDVSATAPAEDATEPGNTAPFSLDAETVEVCIEAGRGGARHGHLLHVFRAPTAADRLQYSRIHSQALYVRGSKTLKSLLPPRLPALAALYDKLIVEARGYAMNGEPLTGQEACRHWMDPLHKKVAVQALFEE